MKGYREVHIKSNTNDIQYIWFKADMSDQGIIADYEARGGKREYLMFEKKPDVNQVLNLGYECYKFKKGKYVPYSYNTIYDATNYNVMQESGCTAFFFKTEDFETEEPIVIGLKIIGEGVSYLRLPKDLEYLKWNIYD